MDDRAANRPSQPQPAPSRASRRHPTPEQLYAIAERAGGVNRLAVLLRYHKYLLFRNQRRCDPTEN